MAKSNNILYIAGAVVLAVGGYFGYQWYKKNRDKKDQTPPPPPPVPTPSPTPESSGGSQGGGNAGASIISNPFKTEAELKAFQNWVLNTKKDTNILGKAGADGKWGKSSASAWTKYGSEYIAQGSTNQPNVNAGLNKNVQDAITTITQYGIGEKAKRTYLESTAQKYPDFVTNWAEAIKRRLADNTTGTTFNFANQIYNSFDANKIYNTLAINKTARVSNDKANLRFNPAYDSTSYSVPNDTKLGTIKALRYNKNDKALFFYVPNNSISSLHKWIPANSVKLE